jgi:GT2 family glycosyltransferase
MLKIFTLHWNYLAGIQRLYESLIPALDGLDYKYYIKDNGSSDGSKEYLESIKSDKVIPYYTGHNRHNFSEGMNLLFEQSKSTDEDYILLLNNDLWIGQDNSIKNMINLMEKDPEVGVVGAKILYPDKKTITHVGVIGSNRYNGFPFHYRRGEQVGKQDDVNREFQAITGAALLTKAKYFGLNNNLIWSFEDISFCLSVKYDYKKKVVYCGDTLFYHEESRSLQKNPVHKLFMQHNVNIFREKWTGTFKMDLELYQKDPNYMRYD